MTIHTKDPLRSPSIAKIFYLSLAIATLEAISAESLISGEDCKVFDLVQTAAATVGAIIADKGAITE